MSMVICICGKQFDSDFVGEYIENCGAFYCDNCCYNRDNFLEGMSEQEIQEMANNPKP